MIEMAIWLSLRRRLREVDSREGLKKTKPAKMRRRLPRTRGVFSRKGEPLLEVCLGLVM